MKGRKPNKLRSREFCEGFRRLTFTRYYNGWKSYLGSWKPWLKFQFAWMLIIESRGKSWTSGNPLTFPDFIHGNEPSFAKLLKSMQSCFHSLKISWDFVGQNLIKVKLKVSRSKVVSRIEFNLLYKAVINWFFQPRKIVRFHSARINIKINIWGNFFGLHFTARISRDFVANAHLWSEISQVNPCRQLLAALKYP